MSLLRHRRFPRARASVRAAREFALATLMEWGITDRHDDIRLCVSELATNAVLHGVPPGRQYLLRLSLDSNLLKVEVLDSGDGDPEVREPDAEGCGGRWLYLVRELADEFGVVDHSLGKTVWAVFKVAAPAGPEYPGL
ncbi:ATP-binding protein [Streptomyces mirabilis]|uniref:ATP-binding protein n=2 Tax=Streptomyces TaxID=1883 RepID=UPI0036AE6C31